MRKIIIIFIFLTTAITISCNNSENKTEKTTSESIKEPTNKVLLSSQIQWEKLNPARGDQSPQAGTIWGDRNKEVPTGFLAKFIDGFSSPPHIHNVTYRAIVISGSIHNDDPKAKNMWMKPGSFWTQPAGESHITSAKGAENIALVEIDKGPYLVKPIDKAFDNGERPINIDVSNIIWLDHYATNWITTNSDAEISFLWKSKSINQHKGLFIKLPNGFNGALKTNGNIVHAVIIKGLLNYTMPQTDEVKDLDTGSYFGSIDNTIHKVSNNTNKEVLIYMRTNGDVKIEETKQH
ncbi:DUF4437 domain-containing protein [uncultured Aquimarina sp.]|uniref:DUF4437 domain-containing protein n=1 Tax=uncultured Aquimarina sp. TaxID=575652 RepID=UPI00262085EE|nr:DUF4437 domain-containing protein [uncultured Aquimarina sp.]